MALISMEGGQLSKEDVILQLERLFPGKWVWDLKDHEENSFLTKFPSKVELQLAIAFGGADIKGAGAPEGARIKFEMWKEKEVGFLLPKVWVRIGGLRKKLREFLELWAISSLLGSTQMVDMETTRKNDFGRVLVVVLNPVLIPSNLDVVIGDHYFELEFELEKMGFDENGEEAAIEWSGGGSKEGDGELEGAELEDGREVKRQKMEIGQEEGSKGDGADISNITKPSLKEQVQNMDEEQFEAFLRKKAGGIMNMVAVLVIAELADKVAEEDVEEGQLVRAENGGKRSTIWRTTWRRWLQFRRLIWGRFVPAHGCSARETNIPWLKLRGGQQRRTWS
jgi:hypothetical protein